MPVPAHGPHCRTLFCWPSSCPDCRQEVFYWGCSCGSRVFFDRLGEPWPVHECARTRSLLPLRPPSLSEGDRPPDETNPMLYIACEFCGYRVRRGRMDEHQRRAHPWRRDAVAGSISFDDCLDEESLCRKLGQALDTRVGIERRTGWNLSRVPSLRSEGPWSDDHQDIYWRAFTSFCQRPTWKENARLEVYDSDPMLSRWDAKRIMLFYREEPRQLSIEVKVENQPRAHQKVINGVSLQELCRIRTFEDVLRM